MTEIAKNGKDEPSEVEVLGDVVLAFLNGLVNIGNRFVEIVFVEIKNGAVIVEGRNMIVGELG